MNKVILVGRVVRDPEVRYSQGEKSTAIAKFTIAVDRKYKKDGEQTADFINCISFGKTAEFDEKYVKQGTKLVIVGHIQTGSYTNKDGQKVYTTDVIIDEQEFAESKKSGEQQSSSRPEPSQAVGDGFMNIPDSIEEELPFA